MRKNCLLTLSAIVLSSGMFAQTTLLKNDGAMLVIEAGATLVVEGGVENVGGGTIDNNGTLEIQGNFLNSATWDPTGANTVIFSGPNDADVTPGSAIFNNVQMNKGSGGDITLLGAMSMTGILSFNADNNKIILGTNNLTLTDPGSIASFDANEYVVTSATGATGYLRKEGLGATETFTFPVGFNSTTYNPAVLAANGGHVSDVFSVRAREHVQEDGTSGANLANGVADVSWEINEGVATGSNVNVTLQWNGGTPIDELPGFDRTMSAVSRHDGTGWDMLFDSLGAAGGANPYTRTRKNVNAFSVFAVGSEKELANTIEADLMAFLEGAYVPAGLQGDQLRALNLVPVDPAPEPYTALGYGFEGFGGGEKTTAANLNQGTNANDGVDWIIVELRDAADNTSVVASRAGILQRDGDIVDLDGSSLLQIYGVPEGNYFVALRFRNHLGVMTIAAVPFVSLGSFDFTTAAPAQVYGGTSAMNTASDGKKVLIRGDVNYDKIVNNTDISALAPTAATGLVNVYMLLDVNLDGIVNNTDISSLAANAAAGKVEQIPN